MILQRELKKAYWTVAVVICVVGFVTLSHAQNRSGTTTSEHRHRWYEAHAAMKQTSMFKNLDWQFVGPTNVSGRMTDVAVVRPKGEAYTLYIAGASGGVWKTTNEGTTWEPIFEHAASTSIGDVTLAPSNQNILWIGTGEANIFRSSMAGAGVYKSVDAGETFEYTGLGGTHTIPRIVIHPTDPDIVYVAASGHEWTDNEERGVYKTTDGGKTWEKSLYINEKTGAIDLVMDPSDPNMLYAATWQRIRKKWNDPRNEPDYAGSGIHKTTDGGMSWVPINEGLPAPQYRGRIGIDLCRTQPNTIYAFIDNYEIAHKAEEGQLDSYGRPAKDVIRGASLFRSDDAGMTWRRVSENNEYMERLSATYGWVFGQMRVDPNDPETVYVMGLFLNVSNDGGKTFRQLRGMHVDHHGLWIDPQNSDYLVNANDGGLAISYDRGENWRTFTDDFPLVQFFNIMVDMDDPFHVYGSVQDHGSFRGVVDLSRGRHHISPVEFESAPGGEGSSHAIDPDDPSIVYSAGFYGSISRTDLTTGESRRLLPEVAEGEPPLRGQWVAPFILSPHNPRILYHGMQYVFRSFDRGDSWEKISPDLTANDPDKMGDISYQTLFALSESPLKFGLLYAGTDDGLVHVTTNGGETWKRITRGLPRGKWISRLAASAFDEGTVYMSQNGKRDDDFAAYLWKSTDYGKTWKDIKGNIPCGPVNVIREDPKNPNLLYIGTDLGVYVTLDGGGWWHTLHGDMPTTFVHDLYIHPREDILVAGTHGRGVWAVDVRPLQALTPEVLAMDGHVFDIEPAVLPRSARSWDRRTMKDAFIVYYLKANSEVDVTILDEDGNAVKSLEGSGDQGLNCAIWDLTGTASEAGASSFVDPGTYTVRVQAGSVSFERLFTVHQYGSD